MNINTIYVIICKIYGQLGGVNMGYTTSGKYSSANKTYTQMPSVANIAREVKNHLGVGMAEKEWQENPELASRKFLHIDAYNRFLNKDTLILLGRTGTGKTSILKSIEFNVNNKKCNEYTDVVLDEFTDLFNILLKQPDDESESQIMYKMEEIIDVAVHTLVMVHFAKKYSDCNELNNVRNYLNEHGLYTTNRIRSFVNNIFEKFRIDSDKAGAKTYNTLTDFYNFIRGELCVRYEDAKNELMEFLKDKSVIVLFDSLNKYDIRQKNEVLAVKALISTCFSFYVNNSKTHIYLKIALPSEVHTRVLDSLPGKQQGNTVLIQWKYKELISFAALRLFYWLTEQNAQYNSLNIRFIEQFQSDNFLLGNEKGYENSKKLLANILPDTCPTCFMFEFDTLSYCMRHTLKKPREVLTIFNALIEELIIKKDMAYLKDNPSKIKDVVHSTQEFMIKSALSMYESSFEAINDACFVVLSSSKFVFSLNDIRAKLKEAAANVKNGDYDKDEILRILFESGLVGVINEVRHIDNPPDKFKTKEPFDFIIANFEYQIKGRIIPTLSDQYVVHPMCYEYYRCLVDNCSMVYPNRFADEDDIISTILKDN